jgi:glycosyltransferase involved in cell wall biosynthesis
MRSQNAGAAAYPTWARAAADLAWPAATAAAAEPAPLSSTARVAVVIPTYNYARFLGAALASIDAQTVAPAEIIVVDDGSTDDPAAALEGRPDVRLLRQPHLGLSAARNTGWRAATSEFVVFLDADDRLRPQAIALNLEQFEKRPECGLAYGAFANLKLATGQVELVEFETPGPDPVAGFLRGNRIGMHGTVMYRRELLEALDGFDATLTACEDYDLYLRAVFRHPVACRPEVLADYVRHDRNMSRDTGMMLQCVLAVLRRCEPLARQRPAWLAALREGEAGLIKTYVTDWARAYLWAIGTREQFGLMRQGLKLATLAPDAVAAAVFDPILTGLARRVGHRIGWRRTF